MSAWLDGPCDHNIVQGYLSVVVNVGHQLAFQAQVLNEWPSKSRSNTLSRETPISCKQGPQACMVHCGYQEV